MGTERSGERRAKRVEMWCDGDRWLCPMSLFTDNIAPRLYSNSEDTPSVLGQSRFCLWVERQPRLFGDCVVLETADLCVTSMASPVRERLINIGTSSKEKGARLITRKESGQAGNRAAQSFPSDAACGTRAWMTGSEHAQSKLSTNSNLFAFFWVIDWLSCGPRWGLRKIGDKLSVGEGVWCKVAKQKRYKGRAKLSQWRPDTWMVRCDGKHTKWSRLSWMVDHKLATCFISATHVPCDSWRKISLFDATHKPRDRPYILLSLLPSLSPTCASTDTREKEIQKGRLQKKRQEGKQGKARQRMNGFWWLQLCPCSYRLIFVPSSQ